MNKTKFLKFTIAVLLGALLASALYAQLQIESTIDNSVMTIKQINLTADGKDGTAVVTIDGSSPTPLRVEGEIILGSHSGTTKNTIDTNSTKSSVLGGIYNAISTSPNSAIAGGRNNSISAGESSYIVGGRQNTLSNSQYSTIAGGYNNRINANYGFVAGGLNNAVLGLYGFAGGRYAISNAQGVFVWADSQNTAFTGSTANSFLVRALGGVAMGQTSATAPRAGYMLTVVGSGHFSGNLQVGGVGNRVQAYRYCNEDGSACVDITDVGSGLFVRSNSNPNNIFNANTNNVGIGTNDPQAKLHVNGSVRIGSIGDGGTNKSALIVNTNGDVLKRTLNDAAFNGEVDPVWMSQSGNYVQSGRTITTNNGIQGGGNLTANRTLSVDSSVVRTGGTQKIDGEKTFSNNTVFNGNVKVNNSSYLLEADATGGWARRLWMYPRNGDGGISFGAFGSATTTTYAYIGTAYNSGENLRVYKDGKIYLGGNVGIGTTTPTTKLQVAGVITANGGNSDQWNEAYGWGDHSSEGYLTSVPLASTSVTGIVRIGANIGVSNGLISVANGTTSAKGLVQLSNTINTSTTLAATPSTVKSAYDLAATKIGKSGTPTVNTIAKFANTAGDVTNSNISDNGSEISISTDLRVVGKVITDTLVNRTVENITVSGALVPHGSTPTAYRNLGSATTGWNKIFASLTTGSTETTVVVKGANNELKTRTLSSVAFGGETDTLQTVTNRGNSTTNNMYINNSSPTMYFRDTDQRGAAIHVNSNIFYVLTADGVNGPGWAVNGSYWPLTINTTNDTSTFGGNVIVQEGNVGIGTASPAYPLDVVGDIRASRYVYATYFNTTANVLTTNPTYLMGQWGTDNWMRKVDPSNVSVGYATSAGNADTVDGAHASSFINTSSTAQTKAGDLTLSGNLKFSNGGGWYMADTSWIRSYGSKNIYINTMLRADGGLQVGSNGSKFLVESNGNFKTNAFYFDSNDDTWLRLRASDGGAYKDLAVGKFYSSSTISAVTSVTAPSFIGNATTATKLATARTINGVSFNGSANITLPTVNTAGDQTIGGTKTFTSNIVLPREGLAGVYNSTQVQGIWSMGDAYNISTANNDFGTQYGMVYAYTNAGTSTTKLPIAGRGHQILFTTYGTRKASISLSYGNAWFDGKVGIGTTTPSEKLEVNGNIKATAFYYSSDITLKKDLTKISNPLDKILALNGYNFTWRSDDTKDIGVVAQEVEKVFPDAVKADDKGLKSVKYGNLVAPIIEAIKELYNKYLDQQKKIDELEIRINSLEKMK